MEEYDFTQHFKRLCAAFGLAYNEKRAQVYKDLLVDMPEERWRRIVSAWIENNQAFPKVADLLKHPLYEAWQRSENPIQSKDLEVEFVESDCAAKECCGGYIPVGILDRKAYPIFPGNYEIEHTFERTLSFRCPKCKRADSEVPKMPAWKGPLTLRSQIEMHERKQERTRRAYGEE